MHGGNPNELQVYGYSGWNEEGGYMSFHNPSDEPQTYTITLDRKMGLMSGKGRYKVTSPLENSVEFENKEFAKGDELIYSCLMKTREF